MGPVELPFDNLTLPTRTLLWCPFPLPIALIPVCLISLSWISSYLGYSVSVVFLWIVSLRLG